MRDMLQVILDGLTFFTYSKVLIVRKYFYRFTVFAFVLLLVGCEGRVNEATGVFSDAQICRAAISTIMAQDVSIVEITRVDGDEIHLSYTTDQEWTYVCKVENSNVRWAADPGRWRDEDQITFKTLDQDLVIEETYEDGSTRSKRFSLAQLGGESLRDNPGMGQDNDLEENTSKISYLVGYSAVFQLMENGIPVDQTAYKLGVSDALNRYKSLISDEQADAAFSILQQEMQARAEAEFDVLLSENSAAAEAFLASNAGVEGVMSTESGLQYKVLEAAEGPMPAATDTVRVHYEGRLIDGTVFDSSYQRGQPVEFALNQVISGWTEGLQLMPEGSTYELYIPPALGYGEAGAGGVIGPNELLIFKVELLDASVDAAEADASE